MDLVGRFIGGDSAPASRAKPQQKPQPVAMKAPLG